MSQGSIYYAESSILKPVVVKKQINTKKHSVKEVKNRTLDQVFTLDHRKK